MRGSFKPQASSYKLRLVDAVSARQERRLGGSRLTARRMATKVGLMRLRFCMGQAAERALRLRVKRQVVYQVMQRVKQRLK